MAERWQQWMPFHIDRWRGSAHVQAMRAAARAGYLYLLAAAWQSEDCSLPADDEELQVLSGLRDDEWQEHGPRILRRFTKRADSRFENKVLVLEWEKARNLVRQNAPSPEELHVVRSEAGKAGNAKRWGNRKAIANDRICDESESQGDRKPSLTRTLTRTGTETGKQKQAPSSPEFALPEWIDPEAWRGYGEHVIVDDRNRDRGE